LNSSTKTKLQKNKSGIKRISQKLPERIFKMSETVTETTPENTEVETTTIDGQNGDVITETPEDTTPKFTFPKSADDVSFGDPLFDSLGKEILNAIKEVSDTNLKLATQAENFNDDKLIADAQNETEDKNVKIAYGRYEKLLKQIEDARQAVIESVLNKIGDQKLSEEDISALKETSKNYADIITNTAEVLSNLIPTRPTLSDEQKEFITWFVQNVNVPGGRRSSGTSGAAKGSQKPRLNGGRIVINDGKDYPNLGQAAKAISEAADKPVSTEDLLKSWLVAAGVNDWKDTPADQEFVFTVEGQKVMIWRSSK
jgi:hypothetical protein